MSPRTVNFTCRLAAHELSDSCQEISDEYEGFDDRPELMARRLIWLWLQRRSAQRPDPPKNKFINWKPLRELKPIPEKVIDWEQLRGLKTVPEE